MLQLVGLNKDYAGNPALRWATDARLEIQAGEIHGIVGENGAGKSTLFGVVSGLVGLTAGSLYLDGSEYAPQTVKAARDQGVEIVTQERGLLSSLTVAENFAVGRAGTGESALTFRDRRLERMVKQALADIVPSVSPRAMAGSLSLNEQKLVELARAVHYSSRVLLIDEMSAVLDRKELETLFRVLRAQRDAGRAILYISHYLEEVHDLCDRVSVMRDGQLIKTLPISEATEATLTRLMVGRELTGDLYSAPDPRTSPPEILLSATGLAVEGEFSGIDISVGRGEIVGVGGLIGCGSSALAKVLFGHQRPSAGDMTLGGKPYSPCSPREAIARHVAYVPSDRDREGLLLRAPISQNVVLATLPELSRHGMYSGRLDDRRASEVIKRLAIRCRGVRDIPLNLSGGNRQKVVIAKWLITDFQLFILHNPTRGVDVGAKSEIYSVIRHLASAGAAIVLVSDELPELIGMSDRIVLLRRGRVSHTVAREDGPTEHTLIPHMI